MARTDFRAAAARRLSEDRELSPAIVSLLSPDSPTRSVGVRIVPVDRIEPNPEQPRHGLRAGRARRAGRVDPRARRPPADPRPTARPEHATRSSPASAAGGRREQAGLETIPALIEEIDDDTALEIAIIENLQREDLSPLDEAAMYDRMVHEHGYSIRKLADKLGKDKGYLENRLRLADAPPEIRELVSLRKDTLSHAYELMKVEDPKKRRRLAEQVARGELTLIKLRDKIEGRRSPPGAADGRRRREPRPSPSSPSEPSEDERDELWASAERAAGASSLGRLAGQRQAEPRRCRRGARRRPEQRRTARLDRRTDRANLAKYLTIAKLRLENAIALGPERRRGLLTERSIPASQARRPATRPRPPRAPRLVRVGPLSARRPRATPSPTTRPAPTAPTSAAGGAARGDQTSRSPGRRPRPAEPALTAHARSSPSRRRDRRRRRPRCRARCRLGRWRSPARRRPRRRPGSRIANDVRQRAGRPEPAEDRAASGSRRRTAATTRRFP